MKHLSRVVWQEGMYLGPHHFQAQSRFFEETIGFSVSAAAPWGYGFLECEFDAKAGRNGTLSLLKARGVLPDGSPFDVPDGDDPPPSRHLNEIYQPSGSGMDIFLGLPARRSGGNFADGNGDGPPVRFRAVPVSVPDETLGRGEAQVSVGRKNLTLLTAREAAEQEGAYGPRWTSLPAARVTRDASGSFIFDDDFVPAALAMKASPRLTRTAEALVRVLSERASVVAREHAGRNGKWGFTAREVMQFWFLHTLNTGVAKLPHLVAANCHPSDLYLEMARLAGGLCTFATDASPASLPLYDPIRPGPAIAELDDRIRRYLEVAFPTGFLRVALVPGAKGFWEGQLEDARLTGRGLWILGVRSGCGAAEVIASVPEVIKLCSARWVARLVERQLPGLKLQHIRVPPPGCSPSREFQYFSVERSGPCWGDISSTKAVGIYVPDSLHDAELELIAMPE